MSKLDVQLPFFFVSPTALKAGWPSFHSNLKTLKEPKCDRLEGSGEGNTPCGKTKNSIPGNLSGQTGETVLSSSGKSCLPGSARNPTPEEVSWSTFP